MTAGPTGPRIRGRGVAIRPPGRFARQVLEAEPVSEDDEFQSVGARTELIPEQIRSIISRNRSPDLAFSQSINPYRGCEHGCVYCYARPAHAYMDLSPGLDFEQKIFIKPDAPEVLRRELSHRSYRCAPIALGGNTDAYQPAEKRLGITRRILEVCLEFGQPLSIVTKSALVERDLDLLVALARNQLVVVMVSITTFDDELKRRMEPRTPGGRRRLATLGRLAAAGVPCGVLAAPMIPALNDHELENILEAAALAGASRAAYVLVRLPHEVEPIFTAWLAEHYPDRAAKVQNLLRSARGGGLNDPRFGSRMRGSGVLADLLARRFYAACRRLGLNVDVAPLATDRFRVPAAPGQQMDLLDSPG